MNSELELFLADFGSGFGPGVSQEVIDAVQKEIGFELPEDYVEVMRKMNGGEGEIGDNGYLNLFPLDELFEVNRDYVLLMSQIPELFLFGKDAADTGFAFHRVSKAVHAFGLMSSFDYGDNIDYVKDSFTQFLEYLYNK